MKKLNEIFDCQEDLLIKDVKTNTADVQPGDLFVCIKGLTVDRHIFAKDVEKKGAAALVVDKEVGCDIPTIKVDNTNEALIPILRKFYENSDKRMTMIGVTGTDGKTTTSTIIYNFLNQIDKCGYIGTNGIYCPGYSDETNNTTPAIEHLHRNFYNFYKNGCHHTVMEASSEAMAQGRIASIEYDYAIFTNLTREHLNFHKSMENYLEAKKTLFKQTKKDGYGIVNIDDPYGKEIIKDIKCNVITYGNDESADVRFFNEQIDRTGTKFDLSYKGKVYHISSPLLGRFNIYNLTGALCVMLLMNIDIEKLNYSNLFVDGRMNIIDEGQDFTVIVDYAHTPNGYINIFELVEKFKENRIISVAGCAGERDHEKRPYMGSILCDKSDLVIFTYEDPRSENPSDIIDDMTSMVKTNNFEKVVDRHDAIVRAIEVASKGDIIIILGKGNETYEKMNGETIYFNDILEARKALKNKLKKTH